MGDGGATEQRIKEGTRNRERIVARREKRWKNGGGRMEMYSYRRATAGRRKGVGKIGGDRQGQRIIDRHG